MRKFNYLEDYKIINTTISNYINQLLLTINLIKNNNDIYIKAEIIIKQFKNKYPDLYKIRNIIFFDLIKNENVEYYYKNKKFPDNASEVGVQFEKDLKEIFKLEDKLKKLALVSRKNNLTKFNDIFNKEDFLVVGDTSYNLPGTFNDLKIIYIIEVNKDNYISFSYSDSSNTNNDYPIFLTLKKIGNNYINVVISDRVVNAISTPRLIEKIRIKRELKQNSKMYNYDNSLTNEIVLDKTKLNYKKALLISNGCNLLLDEYLNLKQNNIKFKYINKGLLLEYYYEVILPINYSSNVMSLINDKFSKYIEIPKIKIKY